MKRHQSSKILNETQSGIIRERDPNVAWLFPGIVGFVEAVQGCDYLWIPFDRPSSVLSV